MQKKQLDKIPFKKRKETRCKFVILAIREAEIRRIMVRGQPVPHTKKYLEIPNT
jgi:hypothetical protein